MTWPHHDDCHEYYRSGAEDRARCYVRLVELDRERVWVCDVCREWCQGPCDGLTDAELAKMREDQLRLWENDRGEPRP